MKVRGVWILISVLAVCLSAFGADDVNSPVTENIATTNDVSTDTNGPMPSVQFYKIEQVK